MPGIAVGRTDRYSQLVLDFATNSQRCKTLLPYIAQWFRSGLGLAEAFRGMDQHETGEIRSGIGKHSDVIDG